MAIFVSALLFGFYHGNPVQAPYAALVGMVLGYVAMEHNIIWAMVLHMFNNLIFADTIPRLLQNLPVNFQNAVVIGLLVVFALTAAILLIVKRWQVLTYLKEDRIQPWQYNGAFLSPVLLVLVAVCVMDMVSFLGLMLIS
jgi:membrane protease YdiL (CAAX protease family)